MLTRKMKDSGIEWIGEIPEDWEKVKFKYIFDYQKGKKPNLYNEPKEDLYPYVSMDVQRNNLNKYQYANSRDGVLGEKNDICVLWDGANAGEFYRLRIKGVISSTSAIILRDTINPIVNKDYLFYFLKFYEIELKSSSIGMGIPHVDSFKMKNDVISFPSLKKQNIIVTELNSKTKKIGVLITETQQSIEELKKYKQSLITEAVTKGLDPNVEMEQLGSFELPKHWNLTSLGRLFMFMGGYSYKSDEFIGESDNQVIRISNVKDYKFELNKNPVFISDELAIQTENYKIKQHDILFTMTGTKGKRDYFFTKLVDKKEIEGKNLFLNQRVGIMRPLITDINLKFYNYTLKVDFILEQVFQNETGTANQGNIGIEETKKVKVFKPPIEEQRQIVSYLDEQTSRIDKLIEDKTKVIEELEDYKKSLIYEYVTGKKEV